VGRCPTCGKGFDRRAFQVVVPGLDGAFDRAECALQALDDARRLKFSAPPPLSVVRFRSSDASAGAR